MGRRMGGAAGDAGFFHGRGLQDAIPSYTQADQPLPQVMSELPDDKIVVSSDFPHFEG